LTVWRTLKSISEHRKKAKESHPKKREDGLHTQDGLEAAEHMAEYLANLNDKFLQETTTTVKYRPWRIPLHKT